MEGQRVEKKSGGSKKWILVAAAVAAVLVLAYAGLCFWVSQSGTVLPNTTADGVELGGLTLEQAKDRLEETLNSRQDGFQVSLTVAGHEGSYAFHADSPYIVVDAQAGAQAAWQSGRENGFLAQGWHLIAALAAGNEVELPYEFTPLGESETESILDRMDQDLGGGVKETTWEVADGQLLFHMGEPGRAIDREQAKELILQQASLGDESEVEVEPQITDPAAVDMEQVHEQVYAQVKEASLDPETFEITPSVTGLDFDPDQAAQAVDGAEWGTTVAVELEVTEPKVSTESLRDLLFRDLLGEGTTRVTGSANRKSNVKLSAQACNGVILLPGEELSYNNPTGSRPADKGYLPAPIYSGGESVDDIGGGICQTSSTIYYAVLHTTLEVVERHAHMFNTGYVTQGMDATVYFGVSDFRFKNNTDYPVKIVTESYDKGGSRYLTVKIYGTNLDGTYAEPQSSVFDRVDPTTVYKADESIPRGTTKVDTVQNAYTGWSAQTYRYIYDKDGNLLEKQDMGFSKYKMRPKTILYNPADGDPATWVNGVPPTPGQTETGTGTNTGSGSGAQSGTGTGASTETGTGTGTETAGGSGTGTGAETGSGTGTNTGAETGSNAETQPDTETGEQPEQGQFGGNDAQLPEDSSAQSGGSSSSQPSQDVGA